MKGAHPKGGRRVHLWGPRGNHQIGIFREQLAAPRRSGFIRTLDINQFWLFQRQTTYELTFSLFGANVIGSSAGMFDSGASQDPDAAPCSLRGRGGGRVVEGAGNLVRPNSSE